VQVGRIELPHRLQGLPVQDSNRMIAVIDEPVTAQRFHFAIDVHGAETETPSPLTAHTRLRLSRRAINSAITSKSSRASRLVNGTTEPVATSPKAKKTRAMTMDPAAKHWTG